MYDHELDRLIDRLARNQHGVLARRQLQSAGASRHQVAHRVRTGLLGRIDNGVFVHAAHPGTWQQRVLAATMSEPVAVASGLTATTLYGVPRFGHGRPEITVPRGARPHNRIARVRRSDLIEGRRVGPIPVNSPALTIVELAERFPPERVEPALEAMLRTKVLRIEQLQRWHLRLAGSRRPGLATVQGLLAERGDDDVPSASELEAMLYRIFDIPPLQPFLRQAGFPWSPRSLRRCDALIESSRIILEADGRAWHEQLTDVVADRRRDREAAVHGYETMRYTWGELIGSPDDAVAEVMAVHGRRLIEGRRSA